MQNDPTDPIWQMRMKTLTQRKKQMEIGETIRKAISDWYFENGKPEPDWRIQKDPTWWVDYLKELENEGGQQQ
jgi:hypothetical protein